jgi:hypothetical protein
MRGCRIPRYLLGRDELPLVRRPSVYNLRRRFTLERVERNATPPDCVPRVLFARLLRLRALVSHAKHGILYLIDQCPAHGDRNIAEQKQRQGSDVFRFDEPAP